MKKSCSYNEITYSPNYSVLNAAQPEKRKNRKPQSFHILCACVELPFKCIFSISKQKTKQKFELQLPEF